MALSALVFAGGAASGGFLERRDPPSLLVLLKGALDTPRGTVTEERPRFLTQQASTNEPAASQGRRDTASIDANGQRELRRRAPVAWAANVIGVTATVDARAVKLVWQSPSDSDHVVVFRTRDNGKHGFMVFRGRGTSVRDAPPRPCSTYRYTIVSYNRSGQPSTGVPTSVVTGGCT